MKKYLVISYGVWGGEYFIEQAIPFNTHEEAKACQEQLINEEKTYQESEENTVTDITDMPFSKVQEIYKKANYNLFCIENYGDSIIFSEFENTGEFFKEVVIQEIEI